ncbi:Imm51 family immunity protein [Tsukamurella pseudospumae]|uniref:Imm51 family immunity protein n=1 Tax=Tsukamurella pseudospumae TaxID=239498 RepID=UPI000AF68BA6|nr:Imm51 family immunity protein [Tsukamurella pseudospumae]
MLTDDEDRQFKPADIAELLAVVVALGLLFWLLDPLNPWLKYPAILLGTFVVLMAWRGVRKLLEIRSGGDATRIAPLTLVETSSGAHSLLLVAGGTPADDAVAESGHEPNGYFWQGVAERVAPQLVERVSLDSESGMFCARADDRDVLVRLGAKLAPVVNDPARLREVVAAAEADGFEFDD